MKVGWTPQAERDREEIFDYIAGFDEAAAERMNSLFERAVGQIKRFLLSAREGKMPGSREIIPHPSYPLVCEIGDDTIWIATLYHTARQWPPVADDETS